MSQRQPNLLIAASGIHGKGVFTTSLIREGEIIEICPVIVIPTEDVTTIHQTILHDYYFIWGEDDSCAALILGYGSIYNHAYEPNAEYYPDFQDNVLRVYALHDILPGEEITVNYNGDPSDPSKLWFEEE